MNNTSTKPVVHHLKTVKEIFPELKSREKRFELRKDDRNFEAGDYLLLQEYDTVAKKHTGQSILVRVTLAYKQSLNKYGLRNGHCIMAIKFREEFTEEEKKISFDILNEMMG